MADHPLRPATRRRLGRPLPHQLPDKPRDHHSTGCPFVPKWMPIQEPPPYYKAFRPIIRNDAVGFSRVTHPFAAPYPKAVARLACLIHAASVRPEPGSNSPLKNVSIYGLYDLKLLLKTHSLIADRSLQLKDCGFDYDSLNSMQTSNLTISRPTKCLLYPF